MHRLVAGLAVFKVSKPPAARAHVLLEVLHIK